MNEQKINRIKDLTADITTDYMPRLYAVWNIFEMVDTTRLDTTKDENESKNLIIWHNTESLKALLDELQEKLDEIFVC